MKQVSSESQIRAVGIIGVFLLFAIQAFPAVADFAVANQFDIGMGETNSITWNGTHYFVTGGLANGGSHTIHLLDDTFNLAGTMTIPANGFGGFAHALRGISYDSVSGNLFVVEFDTVNQVIREVTTDGTILGTVDPGHDAFLNAVAVDPDDQSLWLGYWDGRVEHYLQNGTYLGGFNVAGQAWTGIDVDPVSDTLLLLNGDDLFFEYSFDGSVVDTLVASDQIAKEGFGFIYNEVDATLYAPGTPGLFGDPPASMTVFQDPTRPVVPEPGSLVLLSVGLLMIQMRHRPVGGS